MVEFFGLVVISLSYAFYFGVVYGMAFVSDSRPSIEVLKSNPYIYNEIDGKFLNILIANFVSPIQK